MAALERLPTRARRGSKPRCHLLTHGSPDQVARRLAHIVAPGVQIDRNDQWMPQGFEKIEEAKLPSAGRLLDENVRHGLLSWWLAVPSVTARTPNWDIASTCTIHGKKGLLLVEAKAHDAELAGEEKGKVLEDDASDDSVRNHERIGAAIAEANVALNSALRGWNLSRDSRYQMTNRFAWAWKVTDFGVPVILVYLGFLNANEMRDRGQPFSTAEDWQRLVMAHSQPLLPPEIWNKPLVVGNQMLIPLIRAVELPLLPVCKSASRIDPRLN